MSFDATLDHVVVNAMFGIDAAAGCFAALGFSLTPRGYHSLGSVNHLMMFGDHYLELVGLPVGTDRLRREILESRLGIDGLVLKTGDAQATYARLVHAGVPAGEPQSFSRPVEIDGVERYAEFATTRLAAGVLAAGRVYFCEHRTPQWVFRREWATHPNGARRLAELVVAGTDPLVDRRAYAQVLGVAADDATAAAGPTLSLDGFVLRFVDERACRVRYGALLPGAQRPNRFAALVVEVDDLAALRERVRHAAGEQPELDIQACETVYPGTGAPSLSVRIDDLQSVIEFIGTAEHAHSE